MIFAKEPNTPPVLSGRSRAEQPDRDFGSAESTMPAGITSRLLERLKGASWSVEQIEGDEGSQGERRVKRDTDPKTRWKREVVEIVDASGKVRAITESLYNPTTGEVLQFKRFTPDGALLRQANRYERENGSVKLNVYDLDPAIGEDLKYAVQKLRYSDNSLVEKSEKDYIPNSGGEPQLIRSLDERYYNGPAPDTDEPQQLLSSRTETTNVYSADGRLESSKQVLQEYKVGDKTYQLRDEEYTDYTYNDDRTVSMHAESYSFGHPDGENSDLSSLERSDTITDTTLVDGKPVQLVREIGSIHYRHLTVDDDYSAVKQRGESMLVDVSSGMQTDIVLASYGDEEPYPMKREREFSSRTQIDWKYDHEGNEVRQEEFVHYAGTRNPDRRTVTTTERDSEGRATYIERRINDDVQYTIRMTYDDTHQAYDGPGKTVPMMNAVVKDRIKGERIEFRTADFPKDRPHMVDYSASTSYGFKDSVIRANISPLEEL